MKISTKVILGVCGLFVGAWLAGSIYFLVNGRDEELKFTPPAAGEPLPREENAYYLFPKLHEYHLTNYNFSVANDFLKGWTDSPAILAEMTELVEAHSNLFACARQIIRCRGYQIPEGERIDQSIAPLFSHPTARLYQIKAACEALHGDRESAQATLDELIDFGRFVSRTGTFVGNLVGIGYIGVATSQGGRQPVAEDADIVWRKHLMDVIQELEETSASRWRWATEYELNFTRQRIEEIQTNDLKMIDYQLRDGLIGIDWRMRNLIRKSSSIFTVRTDWNRVRRSCLSAVLSCCLGYSRYAFKQNATLNELHARHYALTEKLGERDFDRDYAEESTVEVGWTSPLRENWLSGRLLIDMPSFYRKHYEMLFAWRCGRLRLACENYRHLNGRYPEELAELVPDCLEALPLDPYDGEVIRYNAEHGYFWTKGLKGEFNGKVEFDKYGYPTWKGRNYHFVQLLDMTEHTRPPKRYLHE